VRSLAGATVASAEGGIAIVVDDVAAAASVVSLLLAVDRRK
jgi:hypothetical protein